MTAEYLLIDISNSFTKLTAATPETLQGTPKRVPTAGLSAEALFHAAGAPSRYAGILLSSVVPAAEQAVERYARGEIAPGSSEEAPAARGEPSPESSPLPRYPQLLKVDHTIALGIGIDYPQPESIGADRLVNAAGAAAFYGAPAVVVDFGTAVTFDILAAPKRPGGVPSYVGGVIAPGLEAMTHYLHERTALLPEIDLREPPGIIGKSTRDAMLAGAVYGYRGLVWQILEEIRLELGGDARMQVIATGGYAELIAARLPEINLVHPNLTLEGLRILAGLNFQS